MTCTDKCWTPIPCPDHGDRMKPFGRDAGHDWPCCENYSKSAVNPRHLWDEHDSTRHYHDPAGWAEHEAACTKCRNEA